MSEPQGYTQAFVDIMNSKLGQSITQAFTAGEEQERERIIALLVNAIIDSEGYCHADTVIALIKGDTE